MLSRLCEKSNGTLLGKDVNYTRVSTDTRSLHKGDVFFALRGENFDGHTYLEKAKTLGACALIVEKPDSELAITQLVVNDSCETLGLAGSLNRESFTGKIIAVTGSNGKTTVKGMLHSILSQQFKVLATEGNFNNHIGVPLTLLRLNSDYDIAVVEAGTSGKGEIAYLTNLIQPNIALVNNVMAAHLEGFGCEAAIAEEKAQIYGGNQLDVGVVNLLDPNIDVFLKKLNATKCIGFAAVESKEQVVQLKKKYKSQLNKLLVGVLPSDNHPEMNSFNLEVDDVCVKMDMNVLGRHNVANAIAAASCAIAAGVALETVVAGLKQFSAVDGRMKMVSSERCALLVDDSYNANPGSMQAAINFLASQKNSLLIVGDMAEVGEEEVQAHFELGQYAQDKKIERVLAVGELCAHLVEGFGEGGKWFLEQKALLEFISSQDLSENVILVKGSRSSKMDNIVKQLKRKEGKS